LIAIFILTNVIKSGQIVLKIEHLTCQMKVIIYKSMLQFILKPLALPIPLRLCTLHIHGWLDFHLVVHDLHWKCLGWITCNCRRACNSNSSEQIEEIHFIDVKCGALAP